MLLSIVVPMYNTEAYLRRCLDSLLDQDLDPDDCEIIVVDDGSDDGGLAIAESYAQRHREVIVQRQENQGQGAARNAGVRLATGRYLMFVDSDDYLASQVLGRLIAVMTRMDLHVLEFPWKRVAPDAEPRALAEDPNDLVSSAMPGLQYIAEYPFLGACFHVYDRSHIDAIGLTFAEDRFLEDVVYAAIAISEAGRVARVPVPVYNYVKRPGSTMRLRTPDHTRRLLRGFEQVVHGLEDLRQKKGTEGAPTAYLDRMGHKEQTYVFFLIARWVRSDLPMRPILRDMIEGFRAIGAYPLTRFPAPDFHGARYALLVPVFNRPLLLRTFALLTRSLLAVRDGLGARSPASPR